MNSSLRRYLVISTLLFALVALVQLARALMGFPVQIGPYPVPVIASWAFAIAVGALAFWGMRLLRRG